MSDITPDARRAILEAYRRQQELHRRSDANRHKRAFWRTVSVVASFIFLMVLAPTGAYFVFQNLGALVVVSSAVLSVLAATYLFFLSVEWILRQ